MSDLIERLRDHAEDRTGCPYLGEAADELERLRRELAEARGLLERVRAEISPLPIPAPAALDRVYSLICDIDDFLAGDQSPG